MFTYGSQVNPSLLRQDFSPILQAAQAQAQATQQAAAIKAQSLAQLGSIAAKGIETYVQKQEQKKQQAAATDFVANVFKANPFLAKGFNLPTDKNGEFDKGALKEFINVLGGPGQAVQVASGLDQMSRARQQQEKELADRARLEQFFTQTPAGAAIAGGARFESLPVGAEAFLPRQFGNAQELLQAGQRAGIPITQLLPVATGLANLGETEAKAASMRTPKPKTIEELRFQTQQKDDERKARIDNRANAIAMGQQTAALSDVNEENAARVLAAKTTESGERKTQEQVIDPDTGRKTTFNVVRDITGKEVSRVPATAPVLSPQEQAEAAGMVKEAENDVAWNEQFRSSVSGSSTRLAQNKYLVGQLRSGKVDTGPTTQARQAIGRVFASFGGDAKQIQEVADYGLAVNILSNQLLDYFAKTKGAISDFETKRFIEFAANPAKTSEENIAILEMMINLEERNSRALEALRESKARTPAEKRAFIEDYVRKNPLDFGKVPQGTYDFTAADAIVRNMKKP